MGLGLTDEKDAMEFPSGVSYVRAVEDGAVISSYFAHTVVGWGAVEMGRHMNPWVSCSAMMRSISRTLLFGATPGMQSVASHHCQTGSFFFFCRL